MKLPEVENRTGLHYVASLAEAWIEMKLDELQSMADESPPSRRRGLKSTGPQLAIAIELGRLPRGGVD